MTRLQKKFTYRKAKKIKAFELRLETCKLGKLAAITHQQLSSILRSVGMG